MSANNERLYQAFEQEGEEVDIQELMQQMMSSYEQEGGKTVSVADELQIRRMLLAQKHLKKDIDHMRQLKDAIVQEWSERIKKKQQQVSEIQSFIDHWLKKEYNKEKLSLDVATLSLRRNAPKPKLRDPEKAREFLKHHNMLEQYTMEAPLDEKLLENSYVKQFKEKVEKIAKERIHEEAQASKSGKVTQKREKEIFLEVERELADDYYNNLPDFFEYVPESKSLSVRWK